jgi:hypothetical protein
MYRSYAETATPFSLTFRRRVSCLCCVAYGIQLLRFFFSHLGLLARPKFETLIRFKLATWTFSTMPPIVGFSENLCFVCLQAKTTSKNEYQHFIPKFILRKYDAEYQEPDLAAFRAKYEGDMSKADKEWKKEKKKLQKRSSVRAVVFEKIPESNSSAEQVAARIARKKAVKVKKESKGKSSAEVVEFGNEEMTMSATAQSLSIELFGQDIKIRIEGRNCSKICGELDMYEELLRWWPFAVVAIYGGGIVVSAGAFGVGPRIAIAGSGNGRSFRSPSLLLKLLVWEGEAQSRDRTQQDGDEDGRNRQNSRRGYGCRQRVLEADSNAAIPDPPLLVHHVLSGQKLLQSLQRH